MMIKGLIVLNGPYGDREFHVGKKGGSGSMVNHIGIYNESKREFSVYFDNGERWVIYNASVIVIEDKEV